MVRGGGDGIARRPTQPPGDRRRPPATGITEGRSHRIAPPQPPYSSSDATAIARANPHTGRPFRRARGRRGCAACTLHTPSGTSRARPHVKSASWAMCGKSPTQQQSCTGDEPGGCCCSHPPLARGWWFETVSASAWCADPSAAVAGASCDRPRDRGGGSARSGRTVASASRGVPSSPRV